MIATLPMYDRWETQAATDRFWAHIRDGLRDRDVAAPEQLTRDADNMAVWTAPDLVLSQTCGRPFRAVLKESVTVVARADFGIESRAGDYHSVIVARCPIPPVASLRVAVNGMDSQSGWAALRDWCSAVGHSIARIDTTGAHVSSARAVVDGISDVAAIDAQTWRLLCRYENWASELNAIARTPPMPGLPYITRAGEDPTPYRLALSDALSRLDQGDRDALGIHSIVPATAEDYFAMPEPDTRPPVSCLRG